MRGECSPKLNSVRNFDVDRADRFQSQTMNAFRLHDAARRNDLTEVERILAQKDADLNRGEGRGWTPLHFAVFQGFEKVAALLVNKGADPNQASHGGRTPLHHAAMRGYEKMVALLVNAGADLNQVTCNRFTPLHCAAYSGYEKVVALLIKAGADLHKPCNDGWTPLDLATQNGHTQIVTLLQQGMRKQEHCRLVSLASLLKPIDLPILVVYKIYCAVPLYKNNAVSRFDTWRVLTAIKQCEKF